MRPPVLRQVEQRIAAHQRDVGSAGPVDVTGFTAGHKALGSEDVRCFTGSCEFSLSQAAQVVARRLHREFAVGRTDVGAEMHPGGAALGNRTLPSRPPCHEFVETEMAEFVPAVGGENHVAGRWGRGQRTQCFEPANKAAAALGSRLPTMSCVAS